MHLDASRLFLPQVDATAALGMNRVIARYASANPPALSLPRQAALELAT
jgi:hypothetical protein